jgi:hypothetical protein
LTETLVNMCTYECTCLESEGVEGEKEEQEKVERKKPCTTTMIYRYRILNTSAWELRGDNSVLGHSTQRSQRVLRDSPGPLQGQLALVTTDRSSEFTKDESIQ